MDEDEIRKSIQDCVIPGNCDPAEVERLSVHGNEANTAEKKFKELNDNDDSGLTETPSVQSRSSSISQGTNDRIDSDLDSITSASQLASRSRHDSPQKASVRFQTDLEDSFTCSTETLNPDNIKVPILGFETMEERSRFTVFRLRVEKSEHDEWHIFRRYTDFVQLNDRLKKCFPNIRLSLPPKRWFRDSFDKNFIEDRQLGLQAFVDNCVGHKDICNSKPVREFFCFDDPPGPHDSIEESRALCESLEDAVYKLRKELVEKNSEIDLLHDELALYKKQVEMLTTALRKQNDAKGSSESPKSSTSLAECDLLTCTEADQSQLQNQTPMLGIEGASDKCERAEKEACSTTEERYEEGHDTPAQDKQPPVDTTRSSPDDKATKKKKRSSIFKFKNKSSETTGN